METEKRHISLHPNHSTAKADPVMKTRTKFVIYLKNFIIEICECECVDPRGQITTNVFLVEHM